MHFGYMILAVFLGVVLGILGGLVPGLHTNLLAVLLATFFEANAWFVAIVIVSLGITSTIVDALPTIFLGAADESNVLAVLPGHKLLSKGLGLEAVRFSVAGSLLGLLFGILLTPVFLVALPWLYQTIHPILFWILLGLVCWLVLRERGSKKFWSVLVFFLSGLLGLLVFRMYLKQSLFPLLSGLFGASTLVLSIFNRVRIPFQSNAERLSMPKPAFFGSIANGVLAGSIITLFPGLGPSQAVALSQSFQRSSNLRYLVLVGAIGTIDFFISLVSWFTISRARNGAIVVVRALLGSITLNHLLVLVLAALVSGSIAAIFTLFAGKLFANFVPRINYSFLCTFALLFLGSMSFFLSGRFGLLVFVAALFVGLLAPLTGVCRSHAMGCLLLPILLSLA